MLRTVFILPTLFSRYLSARWTYKASSLAGCLLYITECRSHSRAVWGVGLQPRSLAGIAASNPADGVDVCLLLSVLCCHVEVSSLGRAVVQRSPTDCDSEASIRGPWPTKSCCGMEQKNITICQFCMLQSLWRHLQLRENPYLFQQDSPIIDNSARCLERELFMMIIRKELWPPLLPDQNQWYFSLLACSSVNSIVIHTLKTAWKKRVIELYIVFIFTRRPLT